MRIARPLLLVTTPLGVVFGVREAWRLAGPKVALLMVAMLTVVSLFIWWTVSRIRAEHAAERAREQSDPQHGPR